MVNLKNMSSYLGINIVRRVIVILGCLLVVFSFIYPFYHVRWVILGGGYETYFWSYASDYHHWFSLMGSGSSHLCFSDYWFTPNLAEGLGIPWILISLFIVQVLTLIFGLAFVVSKRRILSFGPTVFCIVVLVLMKYTGERANEVVSNGGLYSGGEYQLGYYLVCLSLAMFLFALILNEVTKKRSSAYTPTPTLTQ
jgi:uncharacterized membrane protein YphA (DoxX/SURF4 family)